MSAKIRKQIQETIALAEQNCKTHGARLTPKRKLILQGLLQSEKALSAYELIDLCKKEFNESIPAMSAYRILDFLQEQGLAHKLNLANKYVACSHIDCDHSHEVSQFLICGQCQKVDEITLKKSTLAELQHNIELAGFSLASPQLEINCICNSCLTNAA